VTVNVELLKAALDYIKTHPDEWEQENWRCDSGMCFAGVGSQLAGGRWLMPSDSPHAAYLIPEPDDAEEDIYEVRVDPFGERQRVVHARQRAKRLFGLNEVQSYRLFAAGNSLYDIEREINHIIFSQ
jgi:hypothetical protein